jgi:hypothetical protein
MEKSTIWQNSLGYVYPDNESFELEFGRQTMNKVKYPKAKL